MRAVSTLRQFHITSLPTHSHVHSRVLPQSITPSYRRCTRPPVNGTSPFSRSRCTMSYSCSSRSVARVRGRGLFSSAPAMASYGVQTQSSGRSEAQMQRGGGPEVRMTVDQMVGAGRAGERSPHTSWRRLRSPGTTTSLALHDALIRVSEFLTDATGLTPSSRGSRGYQFA